MVAVSIMKKQNARIDFKHDFAAFMGFVLDRFADIDYHKLIPLVVSEFYLQLVEGNVED
jgi:hypothetical protein